MRTSGKRKVLNKVLAFPFIALVRIYQWSISPLLGSSCRHIPSCSQYAVEAIQEWGLLKGTWLALKRVSRCHPWGTRGVDPVPKRSSNRD